MRICNGINFKSLIQDGFKFKKPAKLAQKRHSKVVACLTLQFLRIPFKVYPEIPHIYKLFILNTLIAQN